MAEESTDPLRRIAVVGNYLPRQCGIATFTSDLSESLAQAAPSAEVFVVAMNDRPEGYEYSERVRFEIAQDDLSSYRRAADFLNLADIDVVCVQHEYGIFGGAAGSYLLSLLRQVRAPIVTTLHTVLREPDAQQRKVLVELARLSERLIVMSERGASFLQDIYGIPEHKIDLIPHGIPDVPFVDPNFHKDQFAVEGRTVLLTFGLLSQNKGIEHVISAMPAILEQHPNVVYIVLGATHPNVKLHEGERYRRSLEQLARDLGVEESVRFYDQFVELDELVRFIGAADIYITPYLNPAQIVSGTLAYTVGAGKAVISTPYWYAEEMLADGLGRLVPFRDPGAIAAEVIDLLENEAERHAMRKRAYCRGRDMIWPAVAGQYLHSFGRARAERYQSRAVGAAELDRADPPALRLDHLRRMTDGTGMLQHATYAVPNYDEGYTTDDNARALIAAVQLEELGVPMGSDLGVRYMAFLLHAFNREQGRFRNFMAFDRRWLEDIGSEDSHARALWALGTVLGRTSRPALLGPARAVFEAALPASASFEYLRPWAFTLLALDEYLGRFAGDRAAARLRSVLAERLFECYQAHRADDWEWFEDGLSYDNAVLSHALMVGGAGLGRPDMVAAGIAALDWLMAVQTAEAGHLVPVGCRGFAQRGTPMARFDQQPLEAHSTALACLAAHRLTGEARWRDAALNAFEWFLGRNDLGIPLYDATTGGCRDGLQADGVNQNQGAESTLAYLLSLLALRLAEQRATAAMPQLTGAGEERALAFGAR